MQNNLQEIQETVSKNNIKIERTGKKLQSIRQTLLQQEQQYQRCEDVIGELRYDISGLEAEISVLRSLQSYGDDSDSKNAITSKMHTLHRYEVRLQGEQARQEETAAQMAESRQIIAQATSILGSLQGETALFVRKTEQQRQEAAKAESVFGKIAGFRFGQSGIGASSQMKERQALCLFLLEQLQRQKERIAFFLGKAARSADGAAPVQEEYGVFTIPKPHDGPKADAPADNGTAQTSGKAEQATGEPYFQPMEDAVGDGQNLKLPEESGNSNQALHDLNTYMTSHDYGIDDYGVYSKDPEWQALHRQVFAGFYQENFQIGGFTATQIPNTNKDKDKKRCAWIKAMLPDCSDKQAKEVVQAMKDYSGFGHIAIHKDENRRDPRTNLIMKVFEGGRAPVYNGGVIHRGLAFNSEEELKRVLIANRSCWKEPSITSFSTDMKQAQTFAGMKRQSRKNQSENDRWGLVLSCRNNKTGIPFQHMSLFPSESEILSPGNHGNAKWRIDFSSLRIDRKNKIYYLNMEEI